MINLASYHPDDAAVDRFAGALKARLAGGRAKGRGGWEDKDNCPQERLSDMLREHVEKGDPLDVANFCMFLHQRGEAILPAKPAAQDEATLDPAIVKWLDARGLLPDTEEDGSIDMREVIESLDNHEHELLAAKPAAQGEAVAYCFLRKNGSGEWINDAKRWVDGAPSDALVESVSRNSDLYRIKYAYAHPAAAGVPTWRPIETAPRDGTIILMASITGDYVMVREACWDEASDRWSFPWWISGVVPELWMPLPEPPR